MSRLTRKLRRVFSDLRQRAVVMKADAKPPICILAARRGGSTLLADMFAAQRGVTLINEPFATFPGHSNARRHLQRFLPEREHSQYFDLDTRETEQVRSYVQHLLRNELHTGLTRDPINGLYADRICLKVLNATYLTDLFAQDFGMQCVAVTRHPAAQALSVIRQGWGFDVGSYFARKDFMRQHFSDAQMALAEQVISGNDRWQMAILNWVNDNVHPNRISQSHVTQVAYETLVAEPDSVISALAEAFGLDDTARMRAVVAKPSHSNMMSTQDTNASIKAGDTQKILGGWQKKVDDNMRDQAQHILDVFEVRRYRMDTVEADTSQRW